MRNKAYKQLPSRPEPPFVTYAKLVGLVLVGTWLVGTILLVLALWAERGL
jgi:hypothetical protein